MKFKDHFPCVPMPETRRCILRPFTRNDMNALFSILRDQRL